MANKKNTALVKKTKSKVTAVAVRVIEEGVEVTNKLQCPECLGHNILFCRKSGNHWCRKCGNVFKVIRPKRSEREK